MTSISPYRSPVADAICWQSSTTSSAQVHRLLNSACHACTDPVFSSAFGGFETTYRGGTGSSDMGAGGAPGKEACANRLS